MNGYQSRRWLWQLVLAVAALPLAGCAEPPARNPAGSERSADVRTVYLEDLAVAAPVWTTELEFSTLGMDSLQLGGGESLFARFLDDGTLVIANGPSIVRLGRDGVLEGTVARIGDGPGEFRAIREMGLDDDGSLFAADHLSGRVTHIRPTGEVIRTIRRLRPFAGETGVSPFAMLPDGRLLALPWQWQAAREPTPDAKGKLVRDSVAIVAYDLQGEILDTIALLPGLERREGFVVPFARSAVYAGRGGGRWAAGVSDSVDLLIYSGTSPEFRLVAAKVSEPLTAHQRDLRDSAVIAKFGARIGAAVVERQAGGDRAETPPDIGGIVLDASGRLWIGMYAVPGERVRQWLVYSELGAPLGSLQLPTFGDALLPLRTEVLDVAAGRVAVVRESSDGEIFIEVRRIKTT